MGYKNIKNENNNKYNIIENKFEEAFLPSPNK